MAKVTKAAYERSAFDKEKPGVKEGSKADMKADTAGMAKMKKAMGAKKPAKRK